MDYGKLFEEESTKLLQSAKVPDPLASRASPETLAGRTPGAGGLAGFLLDYGPPAAFLPFAHGVTKSMAGIADHAVRGVNTARNWMSGSGDVRTDPGYTPVSDAYDANLNPLMRQQLQRLREGSGTMLPRDLAAASNTGNEFAGGVAPGMLIGGGVASAIGKAAPALPGVIGQLAQGAARWGSGTAPILPQSGMLANAGARIAGAAVPGAITGAVMNLDTPLTSGARDAAMAQLGPLATQAARGGNALYQTYRNVTGSDRAGPLAGEAARRLAGANPGATADAISANAVGRLTPGSTTQLAQNPGISALERTLVSRDVNNLGHTTNVARDNQRDAMTALLKQRSEGLPAARKAREKATAALESQIRASTAPVNMRGVKQVAEKAYTGATASEKDAMDKYLGVALTGPRTNRGMLKELPLNDAAALRREYNDMRRPDFRMESNPLSPAQMIAMKKLDAPMKRAIINSPDGPLYAKYIEQYSELSKPVNEGELLESIFNKATSGGSITAGKVDNVLDAIQKKPSVYAQLSEGERNWLTRFQTELRVNQEATGLGNIGSSTVDKTVKDAIVPSIMRAAAGAPLRTSRMLRAGIDTVGGRQQERILSRLGEGISDPASMQELLRMRDVDYGISPMIDQLLQRAGVGVVANHNRVLGQ